MKKITFFLIAFIMLFGITVVLTSILVWSAPYVIGFIGGLFDVTQSTYKVTDYYAFTLGAILCIVVIVGVNVLRLKKFRLVSLIFVPIILSLVFAMNYAVTSVRYVGNKILEVNMGRYCILRFLPIEPHIMNMQGKSVVFNEDIHYGGEIEIYRDKLNCPRLIVQPRVGDRLEVYSVWNLDLEPIVYDKETPYHIDAEEECLYHITHTKIDEKCNEIKVRFYTFDGEYIKTMLYMDYDVSYEDINYGRDMVQDLKDYYVFVKEYIE